MLTKTLFILVVFVVGADRQPFATTRLTESFLECQREATACIPAPPFKSTERES